MNKIITNSEKETFNFGKKIAKTLKGGEIIGLMGELGAGKTVFTKGLAAGLDVKNTVNSPTFVLMKIYQIKNKKLNVKKFIHIDAYRLKNSQDIIAIGAPEYWQQPDAVTVIEWADKIKKILPRQTKFIRFKIKKEKREIIY